LKFRKTVWKKGKYKTRLGYERQCQTVKFKKIVRSEVTCGLKRGVFIFKLDSQKQDFMYNLS